MTKIKICGITNTEDALSAVRMGADALGFIFVKKSKRYIEPRMASQITKHLPPFVKKVGVFTNEELSVIRDITAEVKLDLLQIHGDETPEYCGKLEIPYIKAFRIKDETSLNEVKEYNTDYILFDTYSKDEYGGTGKAFDWEILNGRAFENKYVILSGGLNPGNAGEAVSLLKPYAVDVSSGVEESPGKKDIEKINKFIEAVKNGN